MSWFHVRLMNALIGNKDYAVHSAFSNRNVAMYLAGNTNSEDLKDVKLITSPYDFDLSKFAYPSTEDQPTGEEIPKELEKELLDMLDETLRINENLSDRWIKTTIHIDKKKLRTSVQRVIRAMPQMMDAIEASQTEKDFKRPVLKMLNLFLKRLEKAEKSF
ncbi:MAG: hypothetical protein IPK04_22410 [Bdellovibrionales bacterium]|nr:hypothetical protein [Bdellovibrionales bacterium]